MAACTSFIADPCGSAQCAACGKRRRAHRPESPGTHEMKDVGVKALVWRNDLKSWSSDTVLGRYKVLPSTGLPKPFEVIGPSAYLCMADTPADGFAAAQANFNTRIRSALSIPVAAQDVAVGEVDRDSLRLMRQFADMYRSGAQGATMDFDTAMSLALSIDDVLRSLASQAQDVAVAWPNPKLATSEHEVISAQRALDQWQASLKRPDLTEKDRVMGAIEAYQRQAFVLASPPSVPTTIDDAERWPVDAEYKYGDMVEKFTGEAQWEGFVVSAYHTKRLSLRYVIEVEPQGFQMIAVPSQLRIMR